jgi:hypothetical protein
VFGKVGRPLVGRHEGGGALEDSYNCVADAVMAFGFGPFTSEKVVAEGVNDCVTRFAFIFMDTMWGEQREAELASKGEVINAIMKMVVGVGGGGAGNVM